uniref:Uncharacterized protein n=1 Tax=Terrapene triunguis TaxID=2587831 RepID=A0A674KBV7_9SAUR
MWPCTPSLHPHVAPYSHSPSHFSPSTLHLRSLNLIAKMLNKHNPAFDVTPHKLIAGGIITKLVVFLKGDKEGFVGSSPWFR